MKKQMQEGLGKLGKHFETKPRDESEQVKMQIVATLRSFGPAPEKPSDYELLALPASERLVALQKRYGDNALARVTPLLARLS